MSAAVFQVGFKTAEEAEAFRTKIVGDYEIVCVNDGDLLSRNPIAYFLYPAGKFGGAAT